MEQVTVIPRPARRPELVRPMAAVVAVVAGLGGVLLGVTMVLSPAGLDTTTPGSITEDLARPMPLPESLGIPALGLTKSLIPLGHTTAGLREQPGVALGVGWFADGPVPGQPGVAVLSAHSSFGYAGGAFSGLGALKPGQVIYVHGSDGRDKTFTVRKVVRYPDNTPDSVLTAPDAGGPELRLITCTGTYDTDISDYRMAVYAN